MRTLFKVSAFALPLGAVLFLLRAWPSQVLALEARPSARALVDVLAHAAWVLPLLVGLSAWHHGRSRLSFAALSLAIQGLLLQWLVGQGHERLEALPAVFVASASCFLMTAFFDERGILTRAGLPRLLAVLGVMGGTVALMGTRPDLLMRALGELETLSLPFPGPVWMWLVLAACALALAGLSLLARPDKLEVACSLGLSTLCGMWALAARAGHWGQAGHGLAATLLLLAGSLTLIVALHVVSWRHANVDPLTGLPSRRALEERLPKLGGRYCLAVLDIDHFKRVNDRHGHPAGDAVLQAVARRLGRFRAGTVFRSGGEEFTAVCPGAEIESVAVELEALREEVAGVSVSVPSLPGRSARKPRPVKVTISIGAAPRSDRNTSPHRVLAAADEALLRAKKRGRNRLEMERRARSDGSRSRSSKRSSGGKTGR